MASYWQITIFITLTIAIVIPISAGYERIPNTPNDLDFYDPEQFLRDICAKTLMSTLCWNILKPEPQMFNDVDDIDMAYNMIGLAITKSKEIMDMLSQCFLNSNDDKLKLKYHSCSKNYNEVNRNLEEAQRNSDSDDYRYISDQIHDAKQELERCRQDFKVGSIDPTFVGDQNNEFQLYLDMVRVVVERLEH